MQVIMIAHNQLDLVKLGLEAFRIFTKIDKANIVVVDNASNDGLKEWLGMQPDLNYIVCDAGEEKYSVILNTVIREFDFKEDILVISPSYTVLERTIEKMMGVLYSNDRIGAVSGRILCNGMTGVQDFVSALDISRRLVAEKEENEQKLTLLADAVLLKKDMLKELGEFDENLAFPYSVMQDYLLRGVCKGYQLFESSAAYFYYVDSSNVANFDVLHDSKVMREKWGMNYFNDYPNMELIMCINAEKESALNVLEIGCDCGVNLLEVKHQYPNAKIYGVEINKKAAEIAAQIADVEVGNIEDKKVGFADKKFDYIMFGDVLEHLRDPAGTIRYCKELLNENGRIIACIPNLMHFSVMRELLNGNFTYTDMGLLDRTHIHFFTYKEILKMFATEGYLVENISSIRGKRGEEQEETVKLIKSLVELSKETDESMYYAYQYLVTAKKAKE